MEIIRLVEGSQLSVRRTLAELDVNRSTFYTWYRRCEEGGYDGLANRKPALRRFGNRIRELEKDRAVRIALERPEESPRQLAVIFSCVGIHDAVQISECISVGDRINRSLKAVMQRYQII
jgi:putative transposase